MGIIGTFGEVVFTVSEKTVRTIDHFQWSGSARYGVHQRQAGNALTEFTGLDPDQISLEITLSAQLGVDSMAEIWDLWRCMRNGKALSLTIGEHAYGRYRWNITSLSTSEPYFDHNGNLYHAVVTLKLQEYLKG